MDLTGLLGYLQQKKAFKHQVEQDRLQNERADFQQKLNTVNTVGNLVGSVPGIVKGFDDAIVTPLRTLGANQEFAKSLGDGADFNWWTNQVNLRDNKTFGEGAYSQTAKSGLHGIDTLRNMSMAPDALKTKELESNANVYGAKAGEDRQSADLDAGAIEPWLAAEAEKLGTVRLIGAQKDGSFSLSTDVLNDSGTGVTKKIVTAEAIPGIAYPSYDQATATFKYDPSNGDHQTWLKREIRALAGHNDQIRDAAFGNKAAISRGEAPEYLWEQRVREGFGNISKNATGYLENPGSALDMLSKLSGSDSGRRAIVQAVAEFGNQSDPNVQAIKGMLPKYLAGTLATTDAARLTNSAMGIMNGMSKNEKDFIPVISGAEIYNLMDALDSVPDRDASLARYGKSGPSAKTAFARMLMAEGYGGLSSGSTATQPLPPQKSDSEIVGSAMYPGSGVGSPAPGITGEQIDKLNFTELVSLLKSNLINIASPGGNKVATQEDISRIQGYFGEETRGNLARLRGVAKIYSDKLQR
jgi:hypothetical protein